jgi:Tol biopolymer transport system component
MKHILFIVVLFAFSFPGLRAQDQIPEAKKIMGLYNEESSWSPDGKTIAFDSSRPGKTSIFTWNIETREQKRLTSGDASDITPEWSPDGKQIAFVSDRTGHNEIYVINSNGGDAREVTHDKSDNIHAHWSPDGQRIIYCSARDNTDQAHAPEGEVYEIYTIKLDGTDTKRITNDRGINTYPSFSHDGRHIVFRKIIAEKNSEVFVMNADGSSSRNLTSNPGFDGWPRWSPDDSKIVFASNRGGKDYEIYVINADGTGVRQVTQSHGRNTSPKWSPDGRKISFDHAAQGECDIFVVDAK